MSVDRQAQPQSSGARTLAQRWGGALLTALLVLVLLASGAAGLRVADAAWSPHDETRLVADALQRQDSLSRDDALAGSGGTAQRDALEAVLRGLASAHDTSRPVAERLAAVRARLAEVDATGPIIRGVAADGPPGGAWSAAWRLLLAVDAESLSGADQDRERVRSEAAQILTALRASRNGVLGSTAATGARPVDTVVAVAALRRADRSVGVPGAAAAVTVWLRQIEPLRDTGSQLLPHRVDGRGLVLAGPRATSQAVIQLFWPEIDASTSSRDWVAFENIFLCPRLGMAVVCEYPGGTGSADADSGPLVLGVSPRATLSTLAAARAHGNADLGREISREAELLGLGSGGWGDAADDGRPPLDVVLTWARSVPVADDLPGVDERPPVPWPGLLLVALAPGLLAFSALSWRLVGRRRHVSGPLDVDAEPPSPLDARGR
ncbi:MAG: hypothetical protein ABI746_01435 [Dermatophilaceae bacterium]